MKLKQLRLKLKKTAEKKKSLINAFGFIFLNQNDWDFNKKIFVEQ